MAHQLCAQFTIIRGEELKEKGMGGIYGVGKAAVSPPALAILSHTPAGATETIAWVGKGIVYDTGGLSIKGKVTYLTDLISNRKLSSDLIKYNLHICGHFAFFENNICQLMTR